MELGVAFEKSFSYLIIDLTLDSLAGFLQDGFSSRRSCSDIQDGVGIT